MKTRFGYLLLFFGLLVSSPALGKSGQPAVDTNALASASELTGVYYALRHGESVPSSQHRVCATMATGTDAGSTFVAHGVVAHEVELLARYGEIGIVPLVFGPYALCEPFGPPPPPEYQAWEWPWRALLDANPGLPVAWHGDDPWFGRIRPLDDLYSLVTRNEVGEDGRVCEAPDWQKAHTVTVAEALPMMTSNAAYALFRDEEVGSLEQGKYADVIALTGNPMAIEPEAIRELNVALTMIGGRAVYCADDSQNLCPTSETPTE